MGYRRLFIMRKDLNMSAGKLAAQVGHCAEAYWTRLVRENTNEIFSAEDGNLIGNYISCFTLSKDTFEQYINGAFVKTICEARNKNHLLKAKTMADELGLVEDMDYFMIRDNCRTELTPEDYDKNGNGTTLVGISFKPLPDEIVHKISKKYQLYK